MPHLLIRACLGFVAGVVATYAIVLFGTVLVWSLIGVVDRDGGGHMALAFIIAPGFAIVGGLVAGVLAARWRGRSQAKTGGTGRPVFATLAGGAVGALVGWPVAMVIGSLARLMINDIRSFELAFAVLWTPTIAWAACAIIGALLATRFFASEPVSTK